MFFANCQIIVLLNLVLFCKVSQYYCYAEGYWVYFRIIILLCKVSKLLIVSMLSIVILSVIMLGVVMLSVVELDVVAWIEMAG
jgi:hypothetical protein